ncbi:acyltransferase family protein [Klebsiella pneumoniae]|uniref:acyltransferase family protein n=1 Tax=Pseudomonadota TaxID=1224 RepID=UPI000E2C7E88|nr:acyltransferase [Klebsiella pneumoniae]HDS4074473.1 acyltransferase [Klebsiella pneumoniae subsp. pneumoniae]MCP6236959.1 acyltransferase [Klebsiella pneumoniae]MDE4606334.1 acyltransferase [Klebsiella pneumoniae]MEB5616337.1 acyltransferase [Klebsiella pneumoniae]SWV54137.1 Fucose 4-O-acetylase and related acetyltransferases [Klebsiella pneumoniae]
MGEKNNFDIIRLILASVVMLVHTAQVTRNDDIHFLSELLNSDFAVKGFFAISGFLIAKSYLRSSSLKSYFIKRAKRILPGYIFVIILCFIIGMCVTTLPLSEFITSKDTIKYLIANLTFLNFIQPSLPGVFTENPIPAMDGSLWTIKAEITLYILLPFILPLMHKKPLKTWFIIFLISCCWHFYFTSIYDGAMADTLAKQFVSLSSYFFFGSLLATSENIFHRLKEITIFSLVIYLFAKNTIYSFLVEPVAFSSVVIVFCTGVYKEININKIGDLSYGMYIYHFPIIQTLQYMGVYDENPLAGVLATISLTLSISYASWHLLENRFLKRTNYATQRVNQSNTSIS